MEERASGDVRARPHPAKLPTCEGELKENLNSKGFYQQREVDANVIQKWSWFCGSGFIVRRIERGCGISLYVLSAKQSTEARHVVEQSLCEVLKGRL